MSTRSQLSFPISLRGAWQPAVARPAPVRPAAAETATGRPARQSLRGLVLWLQRARALNSQAF